jgi:7SK snRNA methylphosphate capping enzyme
MVGHTSKWKFALEMKEWKYYDYRHDTTDRFQLLDQKWFEGKVCLDLGCSSGLVTIEIAKRYHPKRILGIDLIENLIEEANATLSNQPVLTVPTVTTFVPRCLKNSIPKKFPNNCQFQCQDILTLVTNGKYDTITCLNVAKWIHLNEGDAGLLKLFWKIWESLTPDGIAILEYQPWKSYVKNRNNSAKSKENFPSLQIRPEQFEEILTEIGFELVSRLGTPVEEAKGFNRPILLLRKPLGLNYTRLEREEALASASSMTSSEPTDQSRKKSKKKKRKLEKNEIEVIQTNEEEVKQEKRKRSRRDPPTEDQWLEFVNNSSVSEPKVEEGLIVESISSLEKEDRKEKSKKSKKKKKAEAGEIANEP